jgi:hypothetical protein
VFLTFMAQMEWTERHLIRLRGNSSWIPFYSCLFIFGKGKGKKLHGVYTSRVHWPDSGRILKIPLERLVLPRK